MRRLAHAFLALGALLICLAAYLSIAERQSAKNRDMKWTDQSSYMDAAVAAYETRFADTGPRNRMPLYPFLQALFYSPDMSSEAFFQHGKRLNVILSLVCVAALGALFFARFSRLYATWSMLLIALIVYAIKSPFFQTELLFYTLFAFAFGLSISAIRAPSLKKSLALGVLFALCQYTKASAMPGLIIFALSHCLLVFAALRDRARSAASPRDIAAAAILPVLVFLILLSPYLIESKQKYGTFFYNVNTTFYIWYDSWDEAKAGTLQAGDHRGWPDLPAEDIPSLTKYLEEHSARDILNRVGDGLAVMLKSACQIEGRFNYAYGYCSQVALSMLALAGCLLCLARTPGLCIGARDWQAVAFVLAFFLMYVCAYAWYMPIIIRGARTLLSLLIPFLWALGLVVHHPRIQGLRVAAGGRQFSLFRLFYGFMLLTLSVEIYRMLDYGASSYWAGP